MEQAIYFVHDALSASLEIFTSFYYRINAVTLLASAIGMVLTYRFIVMPLIGASSGISDSVKKINNNKGSKR